MGRRQCLSLSVVQLKGKHCRKPHCRNAVVDTFGHARMGQKILKKNCVARVCLDKLNFRPIQFQFQIQAVSIRKLTYFPSTS